MDKRRGDYLYSVFVESSVNTIVTALSAARQRLQDVRNRGLVRMPRMSIRAKLVTTC